LPAPTSIRRRVSRRSFIPVPPSRTPEEYPQPPGMDDPPRSPHCCYRCSPSDPRCGCPEALPDPLPRPSPAEPRECLANRRMPQLASGDSRQASTTGVACHMCTITKPPAFNNREGYERREQEFMPRLWECCGAQPPPARGHGLLEHRTRSPAVAGGTFPRHRSVAHHDTGAELVYNDAKDRKQITVSRDGRQAVPVAL